MKPRTHRLDPVAIPPLASYALALFLVSLALGVRLLLGASVSGPTLIVFTIPIIVSAYVGGVGPGLLATGAGGLGATYYLLPPVHSFLIESSSEGWQQVILLFCGTVISLICGALHRARARAELGQLAVARLAAIVESSEDAIIAINLDSIITSWNEGAVKLFGYTAGEMIGTSIVRLIPPERQEDEVLILGKIRRGEKVEHFETRRLTKDGRRIDVSVTASPIRDGAGRIVGASKIARDITVAKEREREIARMYRLYAALSQVNQAIVMMPSREELLEKVCEVLVEFGGFPLAWIGWHDPVRRRLDPVAVRGNQVDYVRGMRVYSDDRTEGCDATGRAFRENGPIICNDMLNDLEARPWREETERYGFRSSAVFPIRSQGQPVGTLTVYADEPDFFQDKEIALLKEAAGDISFGLDNFIRNEERERAERTVRQERDFSRGLLDTLPGVLYLYDQCGRFLRWNRNFESVTGYSGAEIAEMHPLDFFTGEDREQVAARIDEVFTTGESSIEAGLVGKDGRVTDYYFTGVATQFEGRPCLVGVGIDITARKLAQAAQRASEALYRSLFENAPDGILIGDARSTYLDANPSMCRMLGYTHDELVGLNAPDIIARHEVDRIEPVIKEIHEGNSHHREWQFRRKDGSLFPVEVIASLMPDGNMIGLVRDITERKTAERALRELNESLESKVALRTKELQVALTRAEAADQLKSSFLATMSHELRTPLNSIIGFTGVLLQGLAGPMNPEQTRQLGMVQGSARHLLELINDVLDISKIEAGQLEIRRGVFDLPASIERVTGSVRMQAERKGLELTVVIPPDLGGMVGDRRRVEQILLNLLSNAIKFTERGGVRLAIETVGDFQASPEAAPSTAVRFQVDDTGIGIKPEDLDKLFQPFRQIDNGLTRSHEGSGLGLLICLRLSALMGGIISVNSDFGKGSTFIVTLPLASHPPHERPHFVD